MGTFFLFFGSLCSRYVSSEEIAILTISLKVVVVQLVIMVRSLVLRPHRKQRFLLGISTDMLLGILR